MFLQLFFSRLICLPIWWYGTGLIALIKQLSKALSDFSTWLGLRLWIKNLFVPMYGDTSIAGRAMSFGIRVVMILGRGFCLFGYILILFLVFLIYLLILPLTLIGFVFHLIYRLS